MNLSEEIREKDQIAIEWLITGRYTGGTARTAGERQSDRARRLRVLTLEDDKIVRVNTVFDALALAVQTDAAEAPAWWPGRS